MDGAVDMDLVCSIADDLVQLGEEKNTELQEWQKALEDVLRVSSSQQKRENIICEAIQNLTKEAEEADLKCQAVTNEQTSVELAAATAKLEQVRAHQAELTTHVQQQQARKAKLAEELKLLKEKAMRASEKDANDLRILKERVKLYSNVCNIRWQYDCAPEEIKGYMCNNGSVRPLHFNRNQNSNFYTVNAIWDMMEPDW